MKLTPRAIPGLFDIDLAPFSDQRGVLTKLFNDEIFQEHGAELHFRQILHSQTGPRHTVRGLYVQLGDATEAKIVYPLAGRLVWTVVDVRRGSPTFGRSDVVPLDGGKPRAFLALPGFAHGSLTLDDDVHVILAGDRGHAENKSAGFHWKDPDLGIPWPAFAGEPVISAMHAGYGSFKDFVAQFGGV